MAAKKYMAARTRSNYNSVQLWKLIFQYVFFILPRVEKELKMWESKITHFSSPVLQKQAQDSINKKKFHCQGGAFFALYSSAFQKELLSFIVSFQTISDYLDNLCDRVDFKEFISPLGCEAAKELSHAAESTFAGRYGHVGAAYNRELDKDIYLAGIFRKLHSSMLITLKAEESPKRDYYEGYPSKEDGEYLASLVQKGQKNLLQLPGYEKVWEKLIFLAGLYCELQVMKHLSINRREKYLEQWFQRYWFLYPYLFWNEFAAAAGSTLGIFALLAVSSGSCGTKEEEKIFDIYFPWICCLHIMLDYYIDQEEDRQGNDLNFITCYGSRELMNRRLKFFTQQALKKTAETSDPAFHAAVVKGLLALYLSDPKIKQQNLEADAHAIMASTGDKGIFYMYRTCTKLRKLGIL